MKQFGLAILVSMAVLTGCSDSAAEKSGKTVIRIGHFPNITHAHGVIAHAMSREHKGWFEQRLGPDVEIEWFIYNAGPSAMEGLLADSIDLSYVGPNPALNAHLKTRGENIRVVAGATHGGSALLVQGSGEIQKPEDFRNKKIGTPQLGNTQDVACRSWLTDNGIKVTQIGGEAHVLPTQNPDQLSLFQRKELDAVWTIEPWVSRLELEAGGKLFLEEKDAVTTVLVSSTQFLRQKPQLAKKVIQAHAELSKWIREHEAEAQEIVRKELGVETTREVPVKLIQHAWPRMKFSEEIRLESFQSFLNAAQKVGFLKDAGDINKLIENPQ